jgi:hypothetical protein
MKKNHPVSESGFFNPRMFGAFLLCSAGAWLAMFSFASTPSSGTLTDTSGPVSLYQIQLRSLNSTVDQNAAAHLSRVMILRSR